MNLTKRQRDVFNRLAQGRLYKEIADDLGVSVNTVREHVKCLYKALGINSRKAIYTIAKWSEL